MFFRMLTAALFACSPVETYPDVHSALFDVCSEDEDACTVVLRDVVDDQEGLVTENLRHLVLDADPWFTDLVVDRIRTVRGDCDVPERRADALAYLHVGVLDPRRGRMCIVRPDAFAADPVEGASYLVHEAGHARPSAPLHTVCDARVLDSGLIGLVRCDPRPGGAIDAELLFWEDAQRYLGESTELSRKQAALGSRIQS